MCIRKIGDEHHGEPQESTVILVHQSAERSFVTVEKSPDERGILRVDRYALRRLATYWQ